MKNYSALADEQLLVFLKEGNEAAFNELFERYRNKLYYYILRHTKSPEISEEIVIDIFMKLWKGREFADTIAEPGAFFHKVGYYKAMDFLRTTARHTRLRQAYIERAELSNTATPHELLMDQESRDLLLHAVNQLPPQRKLIYQLSRQEGMSHDEIAKKLNLSRSTVNNTIVSATRAIALTLQNSIHGKAALSLLFLIFF